ncbi:MAG: TraB/GumN family protein [Desulfobulbaceae bacterium]|nr:TraB/GumN family protein [Desulfobulbaceae bacterium]
MTSHSFPAHEYPDDVVVVKHDNKTILLTGTAHISQQSADLVQKVISQEKPDTVCIELDEKRYEALSKRQRWESLDLKQVIRNKQLSTLLVNLILSSYQRKLGGKLGIMPGTELLTAANTAKEFNLDISLCDRDVRVTLRRAWYATSFFKKGYLVASLLASLFDDTEMSEEKLADLRKQDVLSELMNEVGKAMPEAKQVLIDERDIFMAEKIKTAPGSRIVAVVGAGHVEGIKKRLDENNYDRLEEISTIPPIRPYWKIIGWAIPAAILLSIGYIGMDKGITAAWSNLLYWILANGIPTAIGALLAWGHPATILTGFAAAPITSLTPVIGAGYVTAFVQVMKQPPKVKEFESVVDDIASFRGWWSNKLLRVFLVFFLTGLGSGLGTWMGGYRIMQNLLN